MYQIQTEVLRKHAQLRGYPNKGLIQKYTGLVSVKKTLIKYMIIHKNVMVNFFEYPILILQFDITDSLKCISEKLICRHPHVFDKNNVEQTESDINISWEVAKQKEKKRDNILDGVPKTLPALIRARRILE